MKKTDEFIANRIIWKAGKYNLSRTSTFFFKDLSLEIQQYLNTHLDSENSGTPVLFFTKPTKEWTLLCTRQVIGNDNQKIFRITISNIKQFMPSILDNIQKGQPISSNLDKKTEWHLLTVLDNKNERHILHTDKGADLFALLNILMMIAGFKD